MRLVWKHSFGKQNSLEKRDSFGKRDSFVKPNSFVKGGSLIVFYFIVNNVKNYVPINNVKNYVPINPLTAEWALRALIDFTLSNARRFYSSMGNPLDGKGLTTSKTVSPLIGNIVLVAVLRTM